MSIEQQINYQLNKYPKVKKVIKRVYQHTMYALSHKIKSKGNIIKVSPNDGQEYFFGYYDKSPWDASGRYMLCMRAQDTWSDPDPTVPADILIIDTTNNDIRKLALTKSWNVQQGCMAQWLGPDFSSKIIYNDLRKGKYCSVILEVASGKETIINMPIYTVSQDGEIALTLDFSRLHNLRKGYGYAGLPEATKGKILPESVAIWKLNLKTNEISSLFRYDDFVNFDSRPEMKGAVHKVNHLMLSPNGKRFMVLHRWFQGTRKYTRLITCNIDGSEMYNLSDDNMVSHCYWKNDNEIIAYENKHGSGPGYYLMKDKTKEYKRLWASVCNDGHPSYSPIDNQTIVFDSYPDSKRIQKITIGKENDEEGKNLNVVAQVFAPFKYDNDTRCDLHPRWSRDGSLLCFDGAFEGHRGLYIIKI